MSADYQKPAVWLILTFPLSFNFYILILKHELNDDD